jgi:hypothetical protein
MRVAMLFVAMLVLAACTERPVVVETKPAASTVVVPPQQPAATVVVPPQQAVVVPPATTQTVVIPLGATVICADGSKAVYSGGGVYHCY